MHATSERLKSKSGICYRVHAYNLLHFAPHHGLSCRALYILYDAVGKIGLAESYSSTSWYEYLPYHFVVFDFFTPND